YAYNDQAIERARNERRSIRGQFAGMTDFFVPIMDERSVHAVVVSGPVATSVPTTADVLERWRSLTGRQGHPSDPEFSHFVSITLGTLLVEGERLDRYQRLLECFATLCAGRGDAHALAEESWALRTKLEDARFEQRMWETARSMVNEQTTRVWF